MTNSQVAESPDLLLATLKLDSPARAVCAVHSMQLLPIKYFVLLLYES